MLWTYDGYFNLEDLTDQLLILILEVRSMKLLNKS